MAATVVSQYQPGVAPSWPATSNEGQAVTVLLTTFAGLGLPRTLSIPTKASTTVHDLLQTIYSRLPRVDHPLIITTTSNEQLLFSNDTPISALLSSPADTFLPLRLSARLCGGKGGFGSQLRAAGGRMSSRKNRNQQQNTNGSNRNLDGRRLRTVDAAKRLADLLVAKPGMEEKAKKEQKERWQAIIDDSERREEQIKSGKMGSGQGRLDAEYVERKEQEEEKTREAVMKALREEMADVERTGSESSVEMDEDASEDDMEGGSSGSSEDTKPEKASSSGPTFFGWDEDDDDSEEDEDDAVPAETAYQGKGKAKAT